MDAFQPFAAIVLVMALLGGVLWALKRRGVALLRIPGVSGSAPRRLEVVERISLGPQHSLHLVRAGDRLLLVATAPSSCQLLDAAVAPGFKARETA
jgi:flagellar biosynthetic protein FliO